MDSLLTDRPISLRNKLSLRMLILVLLLISYTLLAVWLGSDKWHVAALALPVSIVGLLASVRRMLSPYAVTLIGLLSYAGVLLAFGVSDTASGIALSFVHVVIMVVIGLVLSEIQIMATANRAEKDAIKHEERIISLARLQRTVALEMRRCRRHDLSMSLVLFRATGANSTFTRVDLINALSTTTREFDQLFSLSRHEIGVLCLDTDRPGAMRLVTRIQKVLDLENVAIAVFPEDAVTSTALINSLKDGADPAPQRELSAVAD